MKLEVTFAGQARTIEFYKHDDILSISKDKLAVTIGNGTKLHGAIIFASTERPVGGSDYLTKIEHEGTIYWVYPERPRGAKYIEVAGWADEVDREDTTKQKYYGTIK